MILILLSFALALGCAALAWQARSEEKRRSSARVAALASAAGSDETAAADDAHEPVPVAGMFESAATSRGRNWTMAAGVAVLLVALAGATFALRRPTQADSAVPEVAERSPIELVSMRHARRSSSLVVTGLVHNPLNATALTGVDAVVLAFDRNGEFVTSAKAPLDLPTMRPGDESPFSVTLQNSGDVVRYRVSFRAADGVIRHIDQRTARVATVQP
jgi:hypothetical protein